MIEPNKIGWFAHAQFTERAKIFEEKYHMVDCVISGELKFRKKKVNGRYGDYCLFCDQSYPFVNFKNAPHLLPRMIGSDLFSNFECDNCNNYFSKFETDLSSYLGLGRSITRVNGSKKVPGFQGRGIKAKSFTFKGKKISVIHKENAERDIKTDASKLSYGKPTYIPANVYKLFLKCGLSLLPIDEVKSNYSETLAFLRNDKVLGGSHVCIYRFPLTVKMPLHAYIFRKTVMEDKVPTHVVSFYFDHLIISLPLLLHKDDIKLYGEPVDMPIAPPYFLGGSDMNELSATTSIDDLCSPLELKNDLEEITIQFNKADLDNAFMFNPSTGEKLHTTYSPSESKYLIVIENGESFTKEDLQELVRIIEDKFAG